MRKPPVIVALLFVAFASQALAEDSAGTGIHTLYLIRHGFYDTEDPRDADVGKGLTPFGEEQARIVGQRLALLGVRIDSLHASTMRRARETAEIISERVGLPVRLTDEIRECTPPARRADIRAKLKDEEAAECRAQLERAFERFFRPSPDRDMREVLVCHGNVIRYLVCKALEVDPEAWGSMTIAHCSLTVVQVRPDGSLRLVAFSDSGHLPPGKQTYGSTMPAQPAAAR